MKGLGILSLKQLGIMKRLTDAVTDKKNPRFRVRALFLDNYHDLWNSEELKARNEIIFHLKKKEFNIILSFL